jgi:hypothetical protein
MKVTITYYDNYSLTKEEIIRQAQHNYGENVEVKVEPVSDNYIDMLQYSLRGLVTYDQISHYFNSGPLYKQKLKELRASIINVVNTELDTIVIDNEERIT